MKTKKPIVPTQEAKRVTWVVNFRDKLSSYAVKYNLPSALVETTIKNIDAYIYWVQFSNKVNEYKKRVSAYKYNLAFGPMIQIGSPPIYDIGVFPPTDLGGIFKQISIVVALIKKSLNYSTDDGMDLGIEGSELATLIANEIRAKLQVRLTTDGRPELIWKKSRHQGIEIQVDRGNGVWEFLAVDLNPNYVDMAPLPAGGKSEVWRYRIIYMEDSNHIGMWSEIVEIAVKGI